MMTGFERYTKKTKRAAFLEEMNQVVPWRELCALIEPHYPQAGHGRPPIGVERMLRIYFLQQWFNLSDPGVEEALHDSAALRQFVGIDLGREPAPAETTVCKFRHLLEEHQLGGEMLETVNLHLEKKGVRITTGTMVDATIIHAPASTKNRDQQRDPDASDAQGQGLVLRHEGACGSGQQAQNYPLGRSDTSQRGRLCGAGRAAARRREAGVGRRRLSGSDRGHSPAGSASPRLHPAALPV